MLRLQTIFHSSHWLPNQEMTVAKFPFEKSGKDVEVRGKGREGSKKEEAFDAKQMKGKAARPNPFLAKGKPVTKKAGRGC